MITEASNGISINGSGLYRPYSTDEKFYFGIIPASIIHSLDNEHYDKALQLAMEDLRDFFKECRDLSPMISYLKEFFSYFSKFIVSPKVRILDIVKEILEYLLTYLATIEDGFLVILIKELMQILTYSDSSYSSVIQLLMHILKLMSPNKILPILCAITNESDDPSVRQEAINVIIIVLCKFPRKDIDFKIICENLVQKVLDENEYVKTAALEACAMLQHLLQSDNFIFVSAINESNVADTILQRIAMHGLPRCNEDNRIEYLSKPINADVFKKPSLNYRRMKSFDQASIAKQNDTFKLAAKNRQTQSSQHINRHPDSYYLYKHDPQEYNSSEIYSENFSSSNNNCDIDISNCPIQTSAKLVRCGSLRRDQCSARNIEDSSQNTFYERNFSQSDFASPSPLSSTRQESAGLSGRKQISAGSIRVKKLFEKAAQREKTCFMNDEMESPLPIHRHAENNVPENLIFMSKSNRTPMKVLHSNMNSPLPPIAKERNRRPSLVDIEFKMNNSANNPSSNSSVSNKNTSAINFERRDSLKKKTSNESGLANGRPPRQSFRNKKIEKRKEEESIAEISNEGLISKEISPPSRLGIAIKSLQANPEDWNKICFGLEGIITLSQEYPDVVVSDLNTIAILVSNEVKNLRSVVSQLAMSCLSAMFQHLQRKMDPVLDIVVRELLSRAKIANKFINDCAEKALEDMIQNVTPTKALLTLISNGNKTSHQKVQILASQMIYKLVDQMGPEAVLFGGKEFTEKIMQLSASYLIDANPDVRNNGQKIIHLLMNQPDFDRILQHHLSKDMFYKIQDKLDLLRQRGVTNNVFSSKNRSSIRRGKSAPQQIEENSVAVVEMEAKFSSNIKARRPQTTKLDDTMSRSLYNLMANLQSTEYKKKMDALNSFHDLVQSSSSFVIVENISKIFDKFIPLLKDSNSKVNSLALQTFGDAIPVLSDNLTPVLNHCVEVVSFNLASNNNEIKRVASFVLDSLLENINPITLLPSFVNSTQQANPRYKSEMIDRVTDLVRIGYTLNSRQMALVVVPFMWSQLDQMCSIGSSSQLRSSIENLVLVLYENMGSLLLQPMQRNSVVKPASRQLLNEILSSHGLT